MNSIDPDGKFWTWSISPISKCSNVDQQVDLYEQAQKTHDLHVALPTSLTLSTVNLETYAARRLKTGENQDA